MPEFGSEERRAHEAERRAEIEAYVYEHAEAAGYIAPRKLTEAIMADDRFSFTFADGAFGVGGILARNCTIDIALQRFVEAMPPEDAALYRRPVPAPPNPAETIAKGLRKAEREEAAKMYGKEAVAK